MSCLDLDFALGAGRACLRPDNDQV